MTHNIRRSIHRFASLCSLTILAVASIGGDGCFGDWGTAPTSKGAPGNSSTNNCCDYPGDEYYTCASAPAQAEATFAVEYPNTTGRGAVCAIAACPEVP